MNTNKFSQFLLIFILFNLSGQSQEKLNFEGYIPRLAWYSIPPEETNLDRYQELKDAGITISFSFFQNIDQLIEALDIAEKVGVKIIAHCPELKTDTEKAVKKLRSHPALEAYFLEDEPPKSKFKELAEWAKIIESFDSEHYCYLNLLPTYAEGWQFETREKQDSLSTTYQDYITTFINEVPLKFISYDHYGIVGNTLRTSYFENLEIISKKAKESNKSFWGFALTTSSTFPVHYPIPTLAELRFQVYNILAYGAQAVQYFTYWTPTRNVWNFHNGPIGLDKKRTEVYDLMKQMNKEIKDLSGVFYGSKVSSVYHIGTHNPIGTWRMTDLPPGIKVLNTNGATALVSVLENEDNYFIVIVNGDFKNPINLTLVGEKSLKKVLKDGTLIDADIYSNTFRLDEGDAAIYMSSKK